MPFNTYTFLILIAIFAVLESTRGYLKSKDKKKYLLKETVIGIPVVLALFLFGPLILLSPLKLGFDKLENKKVIVFYPQSKIETGQKLLAETMKAVETNEKFYQTPIKTRILLAPSRFDMFRFTFIPYAGGVGQDFGIIVRFDRANEGVITHELSHITLPKISRKIRLAFPRWFDEGLASYLGKMDYYDKIPQLKQDLREGRYKKDLKRWNGLTGQLNWTLIDVRCCSRVIYGQSFQMIKYLADKYGTDKLYETVLAVNKKSFEEAFQGTFGLSTENFHQEFIQYVQNTPG